MEQAGGGGPKFHPLSVDDARGLLTPQVAELRAAAGELPEELRVSEVYFQATLLPNYLAGSYFPTTLLDATGLRAVGTRRSTATYRTPTKEVPDQPTKSLVLAGPDTAIARLEEALRSESGTAARGIWDNLREFAEIRLPTREEVIRSLPEDTGAGELVVWEAVLHPGIASKEALRRREDDDIFEKWVALVRELGGEARVDYRRSVRGLTFVPVSLPVEAIEDASRYNPLRAIRPMPNLRPITIGILRQVGGTPPEPPTATHPRSNMRVAVFDGGIDPTCPYVAPFVTQYEPTPEAPENNAVQHGSLVTTTVLYGYLDGELRQPELAVDHHRVLPVPPGHQDVELNWILDQIVDAVRRHRYPIVNLSLGPDASVDDDEPHRWTAELDALSRELGTLFIVAVGNNGDRDAALGLNRVQVPSDMANGVGVGAADTRTPRSWNRAPYSAVGPGRYGCRIQPVGLAFGGGATGLFRGMTNHGTLVEDAGTSFATPLVTHSLGAAAALVTPPTPELLRALAAHYAKKRGRGHSYAEHGYGRIPERYDDLFDCPPNEVTVLFRDSLSRDEVASFEVPFPQGIEPGARVRIRWTVAFTAPVDPTDAVDYTLAGIETVFRPHARTYSFTNPNTSARPVTLDSEQDIDRILELVEEGWQPSAHPVSHSPKTTRHTEQRLRDSGKWETLFQQRASRKAEQLFKPRLDLKYLARSGGQLMSTDVDDLDFCLIVTLQAPEGIDLYQRTRAEFSILTPLVARTFVRITG